MKIGKLATTSYNKKEIKRIEEYNKTIKLQRNADLIWSKTLSLNIYNVCLDIQIYWEELGTGIKENIKSFKDLAKYLGEFENKHFKNCLKLDKNKENLKETLAFIIGLFESMELEDRRSEEEGKDMKDYEIQNEVNNWDLFEEAQELIIAEYLKPSKWICQLELRQELLNSIKEDK